MLGTLNESQIESLLKEQVIGRIACHLQGETYIVPINYVYKDGYIYGHSALGKKIRMMRANPAVCFEVEHIYNVFRWQTVIAKGMFEEITDMEEKQQAMQGIIHRIMPLVSSPEGHPSHGITEKDSDVGTTVELILYRIKLSEMSGRFEQN
ncbi:pyridoxamine 5'-phosphate oxidase family protein [Mucilaginibacter pocheonensis]|uniref:Nitroimidazol reductase NimA-like FMN-containing flavoprotein (Pyridoxamine 5'-phosphate oxidase superfamily) n=1 Tax=Mucilaginibacter pocheonensis TaxID=398050 RepID=A0ABU1TA38_9SPHI|nr:pyridoxamine 5'-phosphate oxidase family protein [Mucilaginibacter pocheonensis]MDR6942273.1 nitroimidazol reductase NimA-like FMN-containing flavoprotein (pyridoxamine 5'-phosphate oxidase superfamily) [Mucilaginibacter pocheonensis]